MSEDRTCATFDRGRLFGARGSEQLSQTVDEFHRVKSVADRTRVQAIRSQLSVGVTLCRIAKSELEFGHADQAHTVLEKLRKLVGTVRRHLDHPTHVPPEAVEKIRTELAELESGIISIEDCERRRSP
jgi:hypothetical protein